MNETPTPVATESSVITVTIKNPVLEMAEVPMMFSEGEEVLFVENPRGLKVQFGIVNDKEEDEILFMSRGWVSAGAALEEGFILDPHSSVNPFAQMAIDRGIYSRIRRVFKDITPSANVTIMAEVTNGLDLLVTDVYVGSQERGMFVDYDEMRSRCHLMGLTGAPLVYKGAYTAEKLAGYLLKKASVASPESIIVRPGSEALHDTKRKIAYQSRAVA